MPDRINFAAVLNYIYGASESSAPQLSGVRQIFARGIPAVELAA